MNTKQLDLKLKKLRIIEKQIEELSNIKLELRDELLEYLNKNNIEQYKNDMSTVSYVEKKKVVLLDEEKIINDLKAKNAVRYIKKIPEHYELKSELLDDLKKGSFSHPEAEIVKTKSLAIRFRDKTLLEK